MANCNQSAFSTCKEDPLDRALGVDILVVPDELDLLPDVAKEAIDTALAKVGGAIEPVGAEDSHLEVPCAALLEAGVKPVVEGGTVVPLEVVVGGGGELVTDNVEVATVGPVVPEIDKRQGAAGVHQQQGMELLRPRRRDRVLAGVDQPRYGWKEGGGSDDDDEEKDEGGERD